MSGESGRVPRQSVGQQVRPEPVVEKSFVESVAGFINEVVPQTHHNPSHYEGKESISWVRFDQCDINDLAQFRDKIEVNGNSPPVLLIIGYTNGVQAWVIPVTGEAREVLSWRQGAVKTLKVLPSPTTSSTTVDPFSLKRPLIALCDSAGPGPQFCSVTFISLKTGEQVKTIKFKHPVHDINANKNVVVISFPEKLAMFDAATLEDTATVTTCYPCPGPSLNPIALGDRWLAYADRRLVPLYQSCGGMVTEGSTSYKATVFHAAKSLTKGLKELGESVASNLMGQRLAGVVPPPSPTPTSTPTPGAVTIIDTQLVGSGEVSLCSSGSGSGNTGSSGSAGSTGSGGTNTNANHRTGVVAHFMAHHSGAPIVAMQFDPTGLSLITADKQGHAFHVFRIHPHPLSSDQTAVHHLYTLHRGDTTAKVIDISFSLDSRWVAVSTHRGTTHVFPITPYGGSIGVRTHTSNCVVNRLSRFQRSAGLDDTPSSGRNSPVLSASPTSKMMYESSSAMAYPNPRHPPYPIPTVVKPLHQLRQPLLHNLVGTISSGPSPSRSPPTSKSPRSPSGDDIIKVASVFGTGRGWVAGSPTVTRVDKARRAMDALFVMAYHGNLIEYQLDPRPAAQLTQDKITEDSPIELEVHACAQWSLVRESTSGELRPPLDLNSPLLAPLSPTRPRSLSPAYSLEHDDPEERWMAQVEIHTHAGPHRRLWMGPQFTFKAVHTVGDTSQQHQTGYYYTQQYSSSPSGGTKAHPRSSPVNMPGAGGANVLIEAGSLSGSMDQSPRLVDHYGCGSSGDLGQDPEELMTQLRDDLADAMMDMPHGLTHTSGSSGAGPGSNMCEDDDQEELDMSDVMDISCDPPGPCLSSCSTASSTNMLQYASRSSSRASNISRYTPPQNRGSPRASPATITQQRTASPATISQQRASPATVPQHKASSATTSQPTSRAAPVSKGIYPSLKKMELDEEIEKMSEKLQQASVTKDDVNRALEDSRMLTSSAEELSTVLEGIEREKKGKSSGWKPIQSPPNTKEKTQSAVDVDAVKEKNNKDEKLSKVVVPEPVTPKPSVRQSDESVTKESTTKVKSAWGNVAADTPQTSVAPVKSAWGSPDATTPKPTSAWGKNKIATEASNEPTKSAWGKPPGTNSPPASVWGTSISKDTNDDTEIVSTVSSVDLKSQRPRAASTTTSEDDLRPTADSKKDKKKKKKKGKVNEPESMKEEPSDNSRESSVNKETSKTVETEDNTKTVDTDDDKNISIEASHQNSEKDSKEDDTTFLDIPNTEDNQNEVNEEMIIEVDSEYFHTAREDEFHDPVPQSHNLEEDFQEIPISTCEDFQEAQESIPHNLEDLELKVEEDEKEDDIIKVEESIEPDDVMLRSMHDDNDLARALEEAYSTDDNLPVESKPKATSRTHSRTRSSRTSEMFPFKDDTTDDEMSEQMMLRKRNVLATASLTVRPASGTTDEGSTDDGRGETSDDRGAESSSADDRRAGTSESDVAASPNPRANTQSKNKKKKKKKR